MPSKIRTFDNLRIIDRSDIDFSKIKFQSNPEIPRYGLPEYYPISFSLNGKTADVKDVHYTRVIEIHGRTVPAGASHQLNSEQRYWGLSVLQNTYERLQTLGGAVGNIATLIHEASVGKYKFEGLARVLAAKNGPEQIKQRVQTMDLTKSIYHSLFIDSKEDFVRDNVSFAGIPEVLYNFYMLIAADTGYPITRLFGVSPAGMNSTGESDMRNYYDMVRAAQRTQLLPMILRLAKIISEWKKLEEPYIEFRPLQQLSEKENAELEKLKADKDAVIANTWHTYINDGVMESYETRFLQFGDSLDKIEPPEEELPPVEEEPLPPQGPGQEGQPPQEDTGNNPVPDPNKKQPPENETGEEENENEEKPENDPGEGELEPEEKPAKGEAPDEEEKKKAKRGKGK